MRQRILLSLLGVTWMLSACGTAAPSPTPLPADTPEPTATPFGNYGKSLIDVTYCSPNGLAQKMDIYFPKSGGPWPAFLYVHGGGWNAGDKADGAGWSYLNDQGFLVVSINYRLAAYNIKFPAMIQDVKCAVRYLRAHAAEYNLNPDRIGALGASAGGHLVALLGTSDSSAGWDAGEFADQSSRVQAVVAEAVFSDFTKSMPNSIAMPIYFAIGKLPGSATEETTSSSPVTYVTPDDPPFLILHGEKDGYAPVEQAEELDAKLKAAGVSSTLIVVKGGEHSLNSNDGSPTDPTQEQLSQAILDFLNAKLK